MRKSFTVLAALVATSFANDARLNALGGTEMIGDAANIFVNPAFSTQYKIIEGNITNFTQSQTDEYVVSGLATWHVTENLVLGGYYNENDKIAPLFTNGSVDTNVVNGVNILTYNPYAINARKHAPHLLLGMKLNDQVSLGLDGHYEGSIKKETTGDTIIKLSTRVIAAKLGAVISMNKLSLELDAGTSLPSSQETNNKFVAADGTKDTLFLDTKGFGVNANARVNYALADDLSLRAGVSALSEKAVNKKNDNKGDKALEASIMAGVAKKFEHDMTLGIQSNFIAGTYGATDTDSKDSYKTAKFGVCAEKNFGQTKLFDTHSFRLGYGHAFTRTSDVVDGGKDPIDTTKSREDTKTNYVGQWRDSTSTDIGLSAGTGFTRGKFGLDLYVANLDLNFADNQAGVLALVPVAGATLTMDFAKKGTTLRSPKAAE